MTPTELAIASALWGLTFLGVGLVGFWVVEVIWLRVAIDDTVVYGPDAV